MLPLLPLLPDSAAQLPGLSLFPFVKQNLSGYGLTRHHDERLTNITIGGLDHIQGSAFSLTPAGTPPYSVVLSWDLLAWISVKGRIPFFTNFTTTPELSGPLYITPDIYHNQITEILLKKIHQ